MSNIISLGDRMKQFYENRYRQLLPRRTNIILRVDGKSFHTLTRDIPKPFCTAFIKAMQQTAVMLCQEIQGCKFAYVQSDEISCWLTDYDTIRTSAYFDNNVQKIVSISAAIASVTFSKVFGVSAYFDSRVFAINELEEVSNYFIWRQQDAVKNSVNAVSQSLYPHRALQGKNQSQLQELIFQAGTNWNDLPIVYKRGSAVIKQEAGWEVIDPPIFTQEREFIKRLAPIVV